MHTGMSWSRQYEHTQALASMYYLSTHDVHMQVGIECTCSDKSICERACGWKQYSDIQASQYKNCSDFHQRHPCDTLAINTFGPQTIIYCRSVRYQTAIRYICTIHAYICIIIWYYTMSCLFAVTTDILYLATYIVMQPVYQGSFYYDRKLQR